MKKRIATSLLLALVCVSNFISCGAAEQSDFSEEMKFSEVIMESAAADVYNGFVAEAPMEMEAAKTGSYSKYFSVTDSADTIENSSTASENSDLSNRKIIKNANLSFETLDYGEFITGLKICIAECGGYIQTEESYGSGYGDYNGRRSAFVTARIPEKSYDQFMNQIGELGNLTHKSENANDITMSYVDTESRIKALETEYNALLEILNKATKLEDVIQLQSRISDVTYQLESYKAQLRKYDDLVSYCTVNINVTEVKRETPNVEKMTFGEKIKNGLTETFTDISEDASEFAVNFIVALPYLIIWAVIIIVCVIIVRAIYKSTRRKREIKKVKELCKQVNENEEDTK